MSDKTAGLGTGSGVFIKIFAYTMLLLLLLSLTGVFLFARQFLSFYRTEQQRQLSHVFQPMITAIGDRDKSPEEIAEAARIFAGNNQSFKFLIEGGDGNVLFSTANAANLKLNEAGSGLRIRIVGLTRNMGENTENTYILTGFASDSGAIDYGDLVRRSIIALALMLLIAIFGAVLFAKKVTKPLEDEIIRERALEESQRLFFSAASHELKTPIAAARALVEGMIAGIGDYRDHSKYLRECLKTLDDQSRLVSEILEIVKLSGDEAGPVSVDLAKLGGSVLAEYSPLAEQRHLSIRGEFPDIYVQADRSLLQRVLSNVIANAVQNTPEGGTIRIEASRGRKLRLSILNTGATIPEELSARLFEPFFRLDAARTRQDSRSGLGLAIVKKALDRMKFPFALHNTDEGVLFWVDIPVCGEPDHSFGGNK
jgi:two-component system sensor histidine kinase VanS